MNGNATLVLAGQAVVLLPQKACWLPKHRTLLVADAHLGKAVSFRSLGVPVPRGTTSETLALLGGLIDRWRAERVVFLGDFLHSARSHAAATLSALAAWRTAHAQIELTLVRGNHDLRAGDPPASLGIEIVDEPSYLGDAAGSLALCHHPRARPGAYVLAGHLHPCVRIRGRGRDSVRVPCFHFGPEVGVLPAFGAFTGTHPVECGAGDRVYAIADDRVLALPVRAADGASAG